MRLLRYLIIAVCFMALLPGQTLAQRPTIALGNSGELFEIQTGSYGELFPESQDLDTVTPVLALDIARLGHGAQRLLVPASTDLRRDHSPWLFFDRRNDQLNIVWQSTGTAGFRLMLIGFTDGAWSEAHEIYSATTSTPPNMVLTQGAFKIELAEDQVIEAERQILHLIWRETRDARTHVMYSPIIFVEGQYVGWQESFSLTDLRPEGSDDTETETAAVLPAGLEASLSVEAEADQETITIAFADEETADVLVFQLQILPLELVYLGDEIRARVIEHAIELNPEDLNQFADTMRIEIISMGARLGFHPTVVTYVSEQVGRRIGEVGGDYEPTEIVDFANDLRDYAIDLTFSLLGSNVSTSNDGQIIEIDVSDLIGGSPRPGQLLDLHLAAELPAPQAVGRAPAAIYPSADGGEVLIAWQDLEQDLLLYVENVDGAWSEPRQVDMASLTAEQADDLLRRRAN